MALLGAFSSGLGIILGLKFGDRSLIVINSVSFGICVYAVVNGHN